MPSVGTRLKEAREKKGFSLEEINARTRINSRNLIAIEHDQVTNISSPFFYRSFVRQYAEQVGLDFQVLAPGVEELAGIMRQPDLPGQGEHLMVRSAPLIPRPKRDFGWVMPALAMLGIVVLGSGGYAGLKTFRPALLQDFDLSLLWSKTVPKPTNEVILAPKPPVFAKENAANQDVPKQEAAAPPSKSATPAPVTPAQLAADKIHLELAITERTWLSVTADGKPAYSGILEPLQTKVLEGQDSAKLRTGNAGGVTVIFNGKMIGPIGPHGTTRTVVFSRTGYEIQPNDSAKVAPSTHIGG